MRQNSDSQNYSEYTDGRYVTRLELRNILHTGLVDYQWNIIRNYRENNKTSLILRSINNSRFGFTNTPAIETKISEFEKRLYAFRDAFNDLSSRIDEKRKMDRSVYLNLLRSSSKLDGKTIDDLTLKAMLNGLYCEESAEHESTLGYRDVLRSIESGTPIVFNEDYLAQIYAKLTNQCELVSFFREKDRRSRFAMASMEESYAESPAELIPVMMENYWSYYRNDPSRPFLKAVFTLYYFHYVKPFESCNDLMALLSCKAILSQSSFGPSSALLPIENVLFPSQSLDERDREIQTYNDLTYFLIHFLENTSQPLADVLDFFSSIKKDGLQNEANALSEEEKETLAPSEILKEAGEREDENDGSVLNEERKEAVSPQPQKMENKEPQSTSPEDKTPQSRDLSPIEKPVQAKSTNPKSILPEKVLGEGELAIFIPKREISDKEIKDGARYIREANPQISKAQAIFFASHCTLGCYYTIQDFKKSARCAYETARTSMDNLARFGFYKKMQFKNKFVYTPVKQKGDNEQ